MKINEKTIIKQFWKQSSSKMIIPNTKFFGDFESDMIMIKNNSIYEIEIKLSSSDYMNDFINKSRKHNMYKNSVNGCPNYFYFLTPRGMIQKDAIPEKYGLIEFDEKWIKDGKKTYPMLTFYYTKMPKVLTINEPTKQQLMSLITSLCWKLNK